METKKTDIYQRITDEIANAIQEGACTFDMPWRTSGIAHLPKNAVSKKPYRGINTLVLWALTLKHGYKTSTWATYKQWQELGAQVRKGEKSVGVVFWKFFDQAEDEDTEGTAARRAPMAREYWVFNSAQVDGYAAQEEPKETREKRVKSAEAFFRRLGIEVKPGADRAFYSQQTDLIHLPPFEAFKEPLYYYSVLSHEATHWTGAKHRLDRDLTGRFGSASYAAEELVAELGSAFLCATLGLPTDPRRDHAAYIDSWLQLFKQDKRALFTAAAKAQEAVDWMTDQATSEVEK